MTRQRTTSLPLALPPLPTLGVGSHAAPGWFIALRPQLRDQRFGEDDIEELMADATRVVVGDQLDAGLDVITDGELRRQRFVYEMYQHLVGLERVPPRRRLGITGYDVAPRFRAVGPVECPMGFGLVGDLTHLQRLAGDRPVKIAMPGPLTFLGSIDPGERPAGELIEEAIGWVNAELRRLATAGAGYLQIDEPLLPHPPLGLTLSDAAAVVNRATDGIPGVLAVHVCFGNNAGRPFADRRLSRLIDAIVQIDCHQLLLEFANREMSEVEVLSTLASVFHIAAGVVDVKSFYLESAEDVARRIRQCLRHVPAARLAATADCGLSALPRAIARRKLEALVAGARLVRAEI